MYPKLSTQNMPAPQPLLASFKAYLKSDFALFKPWVFPREIDGVVIQTTVEHAVVKDALRKMSLTDPILNRTLEYLWRSARSREDIACKENVDPSTIKRRWDKGTCIVLNWIFNGDVSTDGELAPIDIMVSDFYTPGDTLTDIMEAYKRAVKQGTIPRLSAKKEEAHPPYPPALSSSRPHQQRLPGR